MLLLSGVKPQTGRYAQSRAWTQARPRVRGVAGCAWPRAGSGAGSRGWAGGGPAALPQPRTATHPPVLPQARWQPHPRGFSRAGCKAKFQSANLAAEQGWPWRAAPGEARSCASTAPKREEFFKTFPEKKSDFFFLSGACPHRHCTWAAPREIPAPHLCNPRSWGEPLGGTPPAGIPPDVPMIQHPRTSLPEATSRYLHSINQNAYASFSFVLS